MAHVTIHSALVCIVCLFRVYAAGSARFYSEAPFKTRRGNVSASRRSGKVSPKVIINVVLFGIRVQKRNINTNTDPGDKEGRLTWFNVRLCMAGLCYSALYRIHTSLDLHFET